MGVFKKSSPAHEIMDGLINVIQALCNTSTTIELRNEATVIGLIAHVDHKMNITLTQAEVYDFKGISSSCDQLFIPGKQIRYIHIPSELVVSDLIMKTCNDNTGATRKRRLWASRMQRHVETKAYARAYKLGKGRSSEKQTS